MSATALLAHLGELGQRPLTEQAGLPPLFAPASAEQAAELLGTCSRQGWRVRLFGAGTRFPGGTGADLLVSSRCLTGFDIYEPDDLTVGIRAGTAHRAAAAQLARHQQLLPLDAPAAADATIGGGFATGEAGPLRAGYGTPRDLALGITLVAGDGRLLHLGGQVVKNVAGYDLVRLVVGSRGTLGLITQLHARLRSLPASDLTMIAELDAAGPAAAAALRLRDTVAPVALELITPAAPGDRWQIALRLHGSTAVTAAAAAAVRRELPGARELDAAAAAGLWQELAAAERAAPVRVTCTALPGSLAALLAAAAPVLNYRSDNALHGWRGIAHAADGKLRLFPSDAVAAAVGAVPSLLAGLGAAVVSLDGTCRCDRGPGALRQLLPGPDPGARVLALERELRLRFDPAAILVGD